MLSDSDSSGDVLRVAVAAVRLTVTDTLTECDGDMLLDCVPAVDAEDE